MKTSRTDPLRVDVLEGATLGLPGRLGLTFAPGKKDGTRLWDRDLDEDLERLREVYGAEVLVTLLEAHELAALGIPDLLERARAHGLETIWFPIRDMSVPSSMDDLVALVERLGGLLAAGRTVVVHCWGGIGRTGLVAACCLVARGLAPAGAVTLVREARPGSLETPSQEEHVDDFAAAWARRR
ncbi:MAG: cyclin-dependent kinase inhibitor 3 family protein [Deltaproteobacteria bacterium]|nr:cyclin-dependent kinase inhibitor 3 family protein [Deltaproteobacteria bacterium]